MEFKEKLTSLAERIGRLKDQVNTEEATKMSFIMPFINALGYDVYDPLQVTPESVCDYGTKKNEKIDYTINIDGQPIMIIECKHWAQDLNKHQAQLFRYYQVSPAKFGVLTNGIVYKFFSDLEVPNKMDDKPFFEVNLLELRESHIEKLREFSREKYDVNTILNSATELKYVNALRTLINTLAGSPTDDYVRFLTKQVYDGSVTAKVIEEFRPMIVRAHNQIIAENVNIRLKSAFAPEVPSVEPSATEQQNPKEEVDSKIITTEEEIQGYYIVRAILASILDIERVVMRDAQSYCAIICDNNNRRPLCRLHFNAKQKYIEIFDANKVGKREPIQQVSDIYKFANAIIETAKTYL
ncbi:MAG: restriction endonuclease [Rikenellaceae bacterium]|nr:restriction endonuclease [Rikenellaceae bacterium]